MKLVLTFKLILTAKFSSTSLQEEPDLGPDLARIHREKHFIFKCRFSICQSAAVMLGFNGGRQLRGFFPFRFSLSSADLWTLCNIMCDVVIMVWTCHLLLLLLTGIDLIAAFYGCLYAGCIPVTVRPPHPQNLAATLPTVRMIIDVSYTHTPRFFSDSSITDIICMWNNMRVFCRWAKQPVSWPLRPLWRLYDLKKLQPASMWRRGPLL